MFTLKEERTRLKHVSLVSTRTPLWKRKKITIEREDLLFALNEEHSNSSLVTTKHVVRIQTFVPQVRKRQKQSSMDATEDSEEHSVIWRMFISSTLQASVFMGKNYSDNLHSIKNTGKDLTMKQMFDIPEKLVSEQSDEIYGVKTKNWENSSWKYLSLIGDEQVISLQRTKVYVFSDSVLCLGKILENPNQMLHGKKDWRNSKVHRNTETLDRIDGEPMEFEWNISQDSPHCSSATKSKSYCQD